jgi:hypothetical protein
VSKRVIADDMAPGLFRGQKRPPVVGQLSKMTADFKEGGCHMIVCQGRQQGSRHGFTGAIIKGER